MNKLDNNTRMNIVRNTWRGKLASVIELSVTLTIAYSLMFCIFIGGADHSLMFKMLKLGVLLGCVMGFLFGSMMGLSFFLYRFIPITKEKYIKYLNGQKNIYEYELQGKKNAVSYYQKALDETNKQISEANEKAFKVEYI